MPCDYSHSPNTGEPFSCRVWVKDAMFALHRNRIIVLPKDIYRIERELVERASSHKELVEGRRQCRGGELWNGMKSLQGEVGFTIFPEDANFRYYCF